MRSILPAVLMIATGAPAKPPPGAASCRTSPMVQDSAPHDSNADPVVGNWYRNADRTIWAGFLPADGWQAGRKVHSGKGAVSGNKTYWVRPRGTPLQITGRRLDEPAPPLEAHVPGCYSTGFQIVALHFPTEGCWQVNARSGDSELQFVTRVRPPP